MFLVKVLLGLSLSLVVWVVSQTLASSSEVAAPTCGVVGTAPPKTWSGPDFGAMDH